MKKSLAKNPAVKKAAVKKAAPPKFKDASLPVEERVADLLARMTLEEKADQLLQETIGKDANPNNLGPENPFRPTVGSVLSFTGGAKLRNEYQRAAVERTRLGIPIIFGFDVVHGWKTCFPSALAQAASFNPALTERLSRVAAEEAWADGGVDWSFSPMVEVARDPRWGRVVEGYGEDPFTSSRFTEAVVRGYQGRTPEDLAKPGRIAACLKHFVGYSASEGGRDYSYTSISGRDLWEQHLPPFEAGVRAGARTLMSSFNDISGVPAVANRYTQTEILRNRWDFTGFVVSDWCGVEQLKHQGYTSDPERQTLAALLAGNDMDMVDGVFRNIPALVRAKKLKKADLDRAVARVLRVKFELGLFERPYAPERPESATCLRPASTRLALEAARECAVLLQNNGGVLPLKASGARKVALLGPVADDRRAMMGVWTAMAPEASVKTLAEAAREAFAGAEVTVVSDECRVPDAKTPSPSASVRESVEAAKEADIVVLALGEAGWQSGECASRVEIGLPGAQEALALAVAKAAAGKPVVALIASGRPLTLSEEFLAAVPGVLYIGQSGWGAARAAMEILLGEVNPSGKLTMTWPRSVGQIPIFYNHHAKARTWPSDYQDGSKDGPMFGFGHGLSYTTFGYSDLKVRESGGGGGVLPWIDVSVTVENTGAVAGKETVILYFTDVEATYTQPVRRVAGFEKVSLAPGAKKTVRFSLSPAGLGYPDEDGQTILEEGAFRFSCGGLEAAYEVSL